MCGIAGIVGADRAAIRPAVQRMMAAMVHRGPDDQGYEEFELSAGGGPYAGFGFQRLAILDLSPAGHQPMVNEVTGDRLVFNGEIYNFRTLRIELEARGVAFRSTGDSEVLLRALSHWGEAALDRLDGMFAFAFFQAATGRVLLARDQLGIKPLYVATSSSGVAFASEVRALLASGVVSDELDPAGIAAYLAYGSPQDPLTIHRHIRSLPAGSCSWIDRHTATGGPLASRRYWSFPTPIPTGEAEAVAALRNDLAIAVRDQCVADVPLGVFLSGGIDSAALAGFAKHGQAEVTTVSVGFQIPGAGDELDDAAATAAALGTHHFQSVLDDDWIQSQWQQWLKAADRPSIDGLNTYIVSGAVSDIGTKVALSGIGADELFGGYVNFRSVPSLRRLVLPFGWIPPAIRGGGARLALALSRPSRRKRAVSLLTAGTSSLDMLLFLRRLTDDDDLNRLGFRARDLGLRPDFLTDAAVEALQCDGLDEFHIIARAECGLYMGNTLLRDADVNSMAHSLEVRVPYLGRRVVERAFALPTSVLAPEGSSPKHVLRRAAATTVPQFVFDRPKRGFSLPVGEWMFGPLEAVCEAAIDRLDACHLFDAGSVRAVWNAYRRAGRTLHWTRPLALVALGDYLRQVDAIRTRVAAA
jgi:asparagine synthase (glutamine-hydrolysing)